MICPFLSLERVTKEIKYDVEGKIIDQRETSQSNTVECLRGNCYIYDESFGGCLLLALPRSMGVMASLLQSTRDLKDGFAETRALIEKTMQEQHEWAESLSKAQREAGVSTLSVMSKLSGRFNEVTESIANVGRGIDGLGGKLDEYNTKLWHSTKESIEKLLDRLDGHGGKIVDLQKDSTRQLLEKLDATETKADATADKWQQSLRENSQELKADLTKETDAIKSALEESQKLLAPLGDGASRLVQRSEEILAQLTTAISEIKAQASEKGEAQLQEQRKTNSLLESVFSALRGLLDRMESVSGKVARAYQEMSELVQSVRDERDEERMRQSLEDARAHNDKGVGLYFRKYYEGALEEFENAIALDPTMAEVHNNRALCLTSLGKDDEAILSFKRALEIDPDMAEAYNNIGLLNFKKKDYDRAASMFEEAVKRKEDYAGAYYNLGNAYKELDMPERAVGAWERGLKLDPANPNLKQAIEDLRGA